MTAVAKRTRTAHLFTALLVGVTVVMLARISVVQATGLYHDDPLNAFVRGAVATDVALPEVELADGTTVARSVLHDDAKTWRRTYPDPALTALLGVIPADGYPTGLELSVAASHDGSTEPVELLIERRLEAAATTAIGDAPAALLAVGLDGSVLAAVDRSTDPIADPNSIAAGTAGTPAAHFRLWPKNGEPVLFDRPVAAGSTLKPLLIARAFDGGFVDRAEIFPAAAGYAPPGGRRIANYAGSTCPAGDVIDGLARSCNSTALTIASRLGPAGVRTALQAFGFGSEHQSSRPVAPSMTTLAGGWPSTTDEASLAIIGQGDAQVTMVDLALAYAALASNQPPPDPRFIASDPEHRRGDPPVTTEARDLVFEGMAAAADHGTAKALHGLDVLAKTGTATRADGHDSDGWVVALYPASHPTTVVVVRVDGTTSSAGGNNAAAIAARFIPSLTNR